ncbi:hypothetical protein [Hymenobacter ruber]
MTTELAAFLAARLRPLSFLERVVGLARPVDENKEETFGPEAQARRIKTPVALAYPDDAEECVKDERYLLPDQNTASIVFFEDQGTTGYTLPGTNIKGKESTLRLLGWFNPALFSAPLPEAAMIDAINKALNVDYRYMAGTSGEYEGLLITASILPAEAALFSKYTYAADLNPMLYPPYRLLGLELKCRYAYRPACPADELPTIVPRSC